MKYKRQNRAKENKTELKKKVQNQTLLGERDQSHAWLVIQMALTSSIYTLSIHLGIF